MKTIIIPEAVVSGRRLGRHVQHDPRSKTFRISRASTAVPKTAAWRRYCAPFDQGNLGSCTGNAMAGALMTGPLFDPARLLDEAAAIRLYARATQLDDVAGTYPPEDTGSSGLGVAKAAAQLGYIGLYEHAMSLEETLLALSEGPVIAGINWYEGFDAPVSQWARLDIAGAVRGGHEIVLDGVDMERHEIHGTQSWGPDWGPNKGKFYFTFATFEQLLSEQGDVVVPHAK